MDSPGPDVNNPPIWQEPFENGRGLVAVSLHTCLLEPTLAALPLVVLISLDRPAQVSNLSALLR
jgi:hypothetical protein